MTVDTSPPANLSRANRTPENGRISATRHAPLFKAGERIREAGKKSHRDTETQRHRDTEANSTAMHGRKSSPPLPLLALRGRPEPAKPDTITGESSPCQPPRIL